VKAAAPGGERTALARLHEDETVLERLVSDARRDGARLVEAAQAEAEIVAANARVEAEREAERIRATSAEAEDRARSAGLTEIALEVAVLERSAAVNRRRAIARAVALALGEGE
jgi:hypothetical protein